MIMKKMSNRLFALLLALVLVVSMLPVMPVAAAVTATTPRLITQRNYYTFGLTDDTYVGYYAIRNASELYGFANMVNNGSNIQANAVLLQDIVVNETVSATDKCLREFALRAARQSKFSKSDKAPERQTGEIVYQFIAQ